MVTLRRSRESGAAAWELDPDCEARSGPAWDTRRQDATFPASKLCRFKLDTKLTVLRRLNGLLRVYTVPDRPNEYAWMLTSVAIIIITIRTSHPYHKDPLSTYYMVALCRGLAILILAKQYVRVTVLILTTYR